MDDSTGARPLQAVVMPDDGKPVKLSEQSSAESAINILRSLAINTQHEALRQDCLEMIPKLAAHFPRIAAVEYHNRTVPSSELRSVSVPT